MDILVVARPGSYSETKVTLLTDLGHVVTRVKDDDEALRVMKKSSFDLLVADFHECYGSPNRIFAALSEGRTGFVIMITRDPFATSTWFGRWHDGRRHPDGNDSTGRMRYHRCKAGRDNQRFRRVVRGIEAERSQAMVTQYGT